MNNKKKNSINYMSDCSFKRSESVTGARSGAFAFSDISMFFKNI